MKQIVLTVAIASFAFGGFAQKKNVTNAVMAFNDYNKSKQSQDMEGAIKELVDAKKYIDLAEAHADTKGQAKTLAYKGMIYVDYAMMSGMAKDNPAFAEADPEKLTEEGMNALKTSKEVDKRGTYEGKVNAYADTYRVMLSNMGSAAYGEQKYEEAMGGLLAAAAFGDVLGLEDSTFYFYGSAAAFNAEQYDIAIEGFQKCADIGYNPGSSAYYLSQSLQKQGKKDEAEGKLKELLAKYPNNKDIMIELINLYIDSDRKEEAEKVLTSAIALDPENAILVFTSGSIYENMGRFEDAEKAYNRTLELDPSNTDAQFALGGLYFNKGADVYNEANKLPFGDTKYDPMIAESQEYFKQALPYLEGAAEKEPKDTIILESLKAVYGKLGMTDKFKETKQKIADIKAGK